MTKKIFRSICIAAMAVLLASLSLIMGALYKYFSDIQMDQLEVQTYLAAHAVETEGAAYFAGLDSGTVRITWIGADGHVDYDSKAASNAMENHLEREEIREALQTGEGRSSRYSTTLAERQFYKAVRLDDGSVLRLSVSQRSWMGLVLEVRIYIIITLVLAIVLSMFLAYRLSRRIVKPLNTLELDHPKQGDTYEELNPLIERICSQQQQLKLQWEDLARKQKEFETTTENMNEGIVLLNEAGSVLSINKTASRLLGISSYCIGKDLLLLNNMPGLQEALRAAQNGEHRTLTLPLCGVDHQVNVSPILYESKVSGIALIFMDITEKERAEQMRREFTANISHELKTPLQSISGCAELLSHNMVEAKDVSRFADRIYSEARRMITLVDDIINLSGLDEGVEESQFEEVDLYALADLSVRNLAPVAGDAGVKLVLTGQSARIRGIPRLISAIIFNLCDNAIKYNRKGGNVAVDVSEEADTVVLSVSDTGVGIPPDQQERIFERFYRVDKSRSKEVGGTGLGLSIVKHAAELHHAQIKLHSVPGEGTTIRLAFPK